jgi:hypothetical protein
MDQKDKTGSPAMRDMIKDQPAIVLFIVFVMESIVAMHSLWQGFLSWFALMMMFGSLPLPGRFVRVPGRFVRGQAAFFFGLVLGEAVACMIVVPWELTFLCLLGNQYGVTVAFFLRFWSIILSGFVYVFGWQMNAKEQTLGSTPGWMRWSGRAADVLNVAFGFGAITVFAVIQHSAILGHKPYYQQLAEYKAKMQQGPDYDDYRFFLRDLDMAFRQGQYIKVKASFIAYHPQMGDVEDVNVSWKQPWDQPRQPVPQQPPK